MNLRGWPVVGPAIGIVVAVALSVVIEVQIERVLGSSDLLDRGACVVNSFQT